MKLALLSTCLAIVACLVQPSTADDLNFLTCGSFSLTPKRWPLWHVHMGSILGELKGKKNTIEEAGMFTFERVQPDQPYFYMKSKKWSNYYVYMTDSPDGLTRSSKKKPGPEGQWKVIRTSPGQFTLSPKKWLNWFMCMKDDKDGLVKGCKNSAGTGGTFFISGV